MGSVEKALFGSFGGSSAVSLALGKRLVDELTKELIGVLADLLSTSDPLFCRMSLAVIRGV